MSPVRPCTPRVGRGQTVARGKGEWRVAAARAGGPALSPRRARAPRSLRTRGGGEGTRTGTLEATRGETPRLPRSPPRRVRSLSASAAPAAPQPAPAARARGRCPLPRRRGPLRPGRAPSAARAAASPAPCSPWSGSAPRWTLCGSASGVPLAPLRCRTNPLRAPPRRRRGRPRRRPRPPLRPRPPVGGAGRRPRPSCPTPAGTQHRPAGAAAAVRGEPRARPPPPSSAPGTERPPGSSAPRAPPPGSGRSGAHAGPRPAGAGPGRRRGPGPEREQRGCAHGVTGVGTASHGPRGLGSRGGRERAGDKPPPQPPRRPCAGPAPAPGSWAAGARAAPGVEGGRVSSPRPWVHPATSRTQDLPGETWASLAE